MLKTVPPPPDPKPADTAETNPPVDARKGTEVLPMQDESSPVTAGMPRRGRAIVAPGEPGIITPEDDVLDTSYDHRNG